VVVRGSVRLDAPAPSQLAPGAVLSG
jgi:hypothetical protein